MDVMLPGAKTMQIFAGSANGCCHCSLQTIAPGTEAQVLSPPGTRSLPGAFFLRRSMRGGARDRETVGRASDLKLPTGSLLSWIAVDSSLTLRVGQLQSIDAVNACGVRQTASQAANAPARSGHAQSGRKKYESERCNLA